MAAFNYAQLMTLKIKYFVCKNIIEFEFKPFSDIDIRYLPLFRHHIVLVKTWLNSRARQLNNLVWQ